LSSGLKIEHYALAAPATMLAKAKTLNSVLFNRIGALRSLQQGAFDFGAESKIILFE